MKVTSIENQKRKKDRYSIFCNGEYKFSISEEILFKHRIENEINLTEEQIDNLKREDSYLKAKGFAINLLSRRDYSEFELRNKLSKKNFTDKIINELIEFLKQKKFLDDIKFAKMWIQNRMTLNPKGRFFIINELIMKGINKEEATGLLTELYPEEIETKNAFNIVEKRISSLKKIPVKKAVQRVVNLLSSKGFSYEIIKQVIKKQVIKL